MKSPSQAFENAAASEFLIGIAAQLDNQNPQPNKDFLGNQLTASQALDTAKQTASNLLAAAAAAAAKQQAQQNAAKRWAV